MPKFRFSLQKLLDLRSRAEDTAHRRLAETQRESRRQRALLADLQQACEAAAEEASVPPGCFAEVGLLLNNHLHLARLEAQTLAQEGRVKQWHRREGLEREELLQAARDRKVIARLKERRRQQHVTKAERLERRLLDEAGAMAHLRHGGS
jgi:flagellar FliJ protein